MTTSPEGPEPRWPTLIALLAVGGLNMALPDALTVGPRWLLLAIVALLILPAAVTHRRGDHALNQLLGYLTAGIITLFLVGSLGLLVRALPAHTESPTALLRSAAALWGTNVLVFALWYWRLDAGGPHARDARSGHPDGAFLFPQMTLSDPVWSPHFTDYLFLAFNTSTALSPTDTAVLSRWAKILMMIQSAVSLTVLVLLAARAVNIL